MSLTLRPLVATPLAPSHISDVETRAHLRWLLRYLLEQPIKHRMPGHPALWVGSCFPDLLGARQIEGLSLRIAEALPDYRQETALGVLGLPGQAIEPADRSALRAAGPHRLVSLAEAALGARPGLTGKGPVEKRARRATVQLSDRLGIPRAEIALALGIRRDSVERLCRRSLARSPEMDAMLAMARRLTLEERVMGTLRAAPGPKEGTRGCEETDRNPGKQPTAMTGPDNPRLRVGSGQL